MTNPSPSQHPHPLDNKAVFTAPASASGTGQPARTGRLMFWHSPDHQARTADKHRYWQTRHDEKAERRRYHDKGLSNPTNPQRSWGLTMITGSLRPVLPAALRVPDHQRHQNTSRFHQHLRPGLRTHLRPMGQHHYRVHLPERYLRQMAAEHHPLRGHRRRGSDPAIHHGRIRPGQIPLPRT